MIVRSVTLRIETRDPLQFINITRKVIDFVGRSKIREGVVLVFSEHTTARVVVQEDEPELIKDMTELLREIVSDEKNYRHDDYNVRTVNLSPDERKNGSSHCRALFLPSSVTIPIRDWEMKLGKWQSIFFVELDGPRVRNLTIQVMGVGG